MIVNVTYEDYKKLSEIARYLGVTINKALSRAIRFYHQALFDIDHEGG